MRRDKRSSLHYYTPWSATVERIGRPSFCEHVVNRRGVRRSSSPSHMLAALLLAALAVTRALPTEYWGGGDLSSEEFYEAAVEKGEAGHGDRRALLLRL